MSISSFSIKKYYLFGLMVLALTFLQGQAIAQAPLDELLGVNAPIEESAQTTTTPEKTDSLSDIPDEYIEEAMGFNEECKTTPHLSQYYNCDCLSSRYLDMRIERKDKISGSSIRLNIENQCKSAVNTAGVRYGECMSSIAMLPNDIEAEPYCECFANTFATLYGMSKRKPGPQLNIAIHERASISCRDPQLAKKLYPSSVFIR